MVVIVLPSQKAPSAKRRIKTLVRDGVIDRLSIVRKHRAPKGALRPGGRISYEVTLTVRKHRAPKGALRLLLSGSWCVFLCWFVRKHRAPKGALRPGSLAWLEYTRPSVRKHRAPKGALRLVARGDRLTDDTRQKAPSAKRRIKT